MAAEVTTVQLLVHRCARCAEEHQVRFVPLATPLRDGNDVEWTHVGLCPVLEEPVLGRIVEGGGS